MTIKLNTNLVRLFSGTYGTFWEINETDDNGEELAVDYDFKELLKSIAKAYQDNASYILGELDSPFIKTLKFDGGFYSPTEYNFKTDELDFTINVDKKKLLDTINKLKDDKDFDQFLHDHYTSYDGFMSFTPNNYEDIRKEITTQGDKLEQSIGAIISYLAEDNMESIEEETYEDWSGNSYGGLDYKIIDGHGLADTV